VLKKPTAPSLSASPAGTGVPDTLTRSFPSGREHFFRINQGEDLPLSVTFRHPHKNVSVVAFTNINNGEDDWYEMPFTPSDSHKYSLNIKCAKPGRYSFRIKYTLDGCKWLWDCVPYSYIMVDPSLYSTIKTYTLIGSSAGHIGEWTLMLPHIRRLECNVLHLLPVTKLGISKAPYAASDLFSLDPAYLDPSSRDDGITQFDGFIDAAAKQGLRVCIDLVFNHVSSDSNIVELCPDWIQADETEPDGFRRAGWSAGETWHKWENLVLLDYDHPVKKTRNALWEYMRQYGLFWAQFAARTKGMIRLDNLHSSNHKFMHYVLTEIRKTYPELTIFAELFTDTATSSALVWNYGLDLMLATPWEHHFVPQLRRYIENIHCRDKQTPHILPITSHDSRTPAEEFGNVQSTIPRYLISALMGCGATGLVQGVEYGLSKKISLVGINPPPDYHTGHDFTGFITKVNRIMDKYKVFQTGGNMIFIDDEHEAIMAAYRFDDTSNEQDFIVLGNLDISNQQRISINLDHHIPNRKIHSLEEMLTGETLKPLNGRLEIIMPPCSAFVLKIHPAA